MNKFAEDPITLVGTRLQIQWLCLARRMPRCDY